MASRFWFAKVAVVFITALLPAALVAPAYAAPKPKISVSASSASVVVGKFVTFKGSVSRSSAGSTMSLQRLDKGKWKTIATTKVTSKKKFSVTTRAAAGSFSYRVRVTGNKKIATTNSRTMKVSGTYKLSGSPTQVGKNVTLTAQLPDRVKREVRVHKLVNGSWQVHDIVESSGHGIVAAQLNFPSTTTVRFHVPETTINGVSYPAWNTPQTTIAYVVWDPVAAKSILADINKVRKAAKKKPLKLHQNNSRVAYLWSKHLHDSGEFAHNPNYSTQISKKWKRAGENIAAGQTVGTVVNAWKNSPGHYKNMIGDYTHVGIGVYTGPNGYKRYFTTIFAKY